jgi:hypothetical protein
MNPPSPDSFAMRRMQLAAVSGDGAAILFKGLKL